MKQPDLDIKSKYGKVLQKGLLIALAFCLFVFMTSLERVKNPYQKEITQQIVTIDLPPELRQITKPPPPPRPPRCPNESEASSASTTIGASTTNGAVKIKLYFFIGTLPFHLVPMDFLSAADEPPKPPECWAAIRQQSPGWSTAIAAYSDRRT